jgi:hypothetical protein
VSVALVDVVRRAERAEAPNQRTSTSRRTTSSQRSLKSRQKNKKKMAVLQLALSLSKKIPL